MMPMMKAVMTVSAMMMTAIERQLRITVSKAYRIMHMFYDEMKAIKNVLA